MLKLVSQTGSPISSLCLIRELHSLCMYAFYIPIWHTSFLIGELGLVSSNKSNISLADLNFSVGKALAAVSWYSMCMIYCKLFILRTIQPKIIIIPVLWAVYSTEMHGRILLNTEKLLSI